MNTTIKELLTSLRLGKPAVVDGIAMMPIFGDNKVVVDYLTLEEAVRNGELRITEVSEGGSVPNLRAENLSDKPILLIDGEELIGAKQNRILNLSILLKEKSVCTIPVSCVERGRWSYRTFEFRPSENIMPPKARALKTKTVTDNIKFRKDPHSDQGLVWAMVNELHEKLGTSSNSDAMYDAFVQKKREVENFLHALRPESGQIGYIIFVEDKPEILEIMPNPDKYPYYHFKFVTAAVIDSIGDRLLDISERPGINYEKLSMEFINSIMECREHEFKPVGYGTNFRYEGNNVFGAGLVYNDCVMHAVFFRTPDDRRRWRNF